MHEDDSYYEDDSINDVVRRLSFDEFSECGKLQMAANTLEAATKDEKTLRPLTALRLARDLRQKELHCGKDGLIKFSETYSLADVENNITVTKEDLRNRSMLRRRTAKAASDAANRKRKGETSGTKTKRTRSTRDIDDDAKTTATEKTAEEEGWDSEDDNVLFAPEGTTEEESVREANVDPEDRDVTFEQSTAPADHPQDIDVLPTKTIPDDLLLVPTNDYESLPTQISDLSSCSKEDLMLKVTQLSEEKKLMDNIIKQKEEEIAALECGRRTNKKTKKTWKKVLPDPETKIEARLLKEMRVLLREDYIHWIKAPQERWEEYSTKEGTMCQMIIKDIKSWPADADEDYKKRVWETLLGPRLTKEFALVRNDVLQKMRVSYLGMLFALCVTSCLPTLMFASLSRFEQF